MSDLNDQLEKENRWLREEITQLQKKYESKVQSGVTVVCFYDNPYYVRGREARRAAQPLNSCPHSRMEGLSHQNHWKLGWADQDREIKSPQGYRPGGALKAVSQGMAGGIDLRTSGRLG